MLDSVIAPRAGAYREEDTRPTIVGLFGAASGIGESARLCFDAASELGLNPEAIDLSPGFRQHDLDTRRFSTGDGRNRGPVIIHINPPELPRALNQIGRGRLRGRRIVGYWAWELPAAPPSWLRAMRHVHEVWVPSSFCARAFASGARIPVRTVPHIVPAGDDNAITASRDPGVFQVVTSGDLRSSLARKNLTGAVTAFRAAFKDDPGVHLSVRLTHGANAPDIAANFADTLVQSANISFVGKIFDAAAEQKLLASADVLLSLHRAEGFGLMLAKAMRMGRPVVATSWSGNLDFMTAETACLIDYELVPVSDPQGIYRDQHWAEPDIGAAAVWLKRLRDEPDLRAKIGESAKSEYPADAFIACFRDALARPALAAEGRRNT